MSDSSFVFDAVAEELQKQLAAGQLQLPVLPKVALEILRLVNDVTADAAAFVRLISSDQVLAGHIMKVANSAAYGFGVKLTSLQQAVARLGLQNIADIAMAATMGPRLFVSTEHKPLVNQLWKESLAAACWSREIARYLRQNVEAAFLCGLLYQIGKPVVLQAVVNIANKQSLTLDMETLLALLKAYYGRVGLELAKTWRLPDAVIECMRAFTGHRVGAHYDDLVATVSAANCFIALTLDNEVHGEGNDNSARQSLAALPALMNANLYPDDIEELLKKTGTIRSLLEAMTL
jgi:HD-like signal output (HDOD) protein